MITLMLTTMGQIPLLMSHILEHGAAIHPTAEIVTWGETAIRRSSFAMVADNCRRLACALNELGITAGQPVATLMWNNQEHLELYFAVPGIGAVVHPLNLRLSPEQLRFIVRCAEDQVIVVDACLLGVLVPLLPDLPALRTVIVNGPVPSELAGPLSSTGVAVHDYAALLAGRPDTYTWPELPEDCAMGMCFTSGTTGDPKGVVYSQRSTYLHALQICMPNSFDIGQADRLLGMVPMFHALGWGLPYAAFLTGASLVLPERFLQAQPLVAMLARERITVTGGVPTLADAIARHLDAEDNAEAPPSLADLRIFVVGGSTCPPHLIRTFEQRHGVQIRHAWGMTETSPLAAIATAPPHAVGEDRWRYLESQGRIVPGLQARLIADDGSLLPADGETVGELQVRGPWVTASYFRGADPAAFDSGWLRTGDVGSLSPDGYLRLTDRTKDIIKSGGEWISSVELENHLLAHAQVAQACVIGVPDDTWGERPLAAVVLSGVADPASWPTPLAAYLGERVPRWQVPERWALIDEVPLTSVGKFDKVALRARHAAGELVVTWLQPGA